MSKEQLHELSKFFYGDSTEFSEVELQIANDRFSHRCSAERIADEIKYGACDFEDIL